MKKLTETWKKKKPLPETVRYIAIKSKQEKEKHFEYNHGQNKSTRNGISNVNTINANKKYIQDVFMSQSVMDKIKKSSSTKKYSVSKSQRQRLKPESIKGIDVNEKNHIDINTKKTKSDVFSNSGNIIKIVEQSGKEHLHKKTTGLEKNKSKTVETYTIVKNKCLLLASNESENEKIDISDYAIEIHSSDNDESLLKTNQHLLSSWNLPTSVVENYEKRGVKEMFKWQVDCLLTGKVLKGGNLVYSAPTSAGKTMITEILMLKKVLEYHKKAIMILPFVSVAREKMLYFQEIFSDAGIRVDGYMGCHSPAGGFNSVDIAICTIEKANSLINRLLEEKRIHQIGILIIDELHMLGDSHRGYLLELLLTKILYMSKRYPVEGHKTQIIGMSATLPNLSTLAQWLEGDLYITEFRPVPLQELIKIGPILYNAVTLKETRNLEKFKMFQNDMDHTIYLSVETVVSGQSVLIFCPTKVWCEKLANSIAEEIFKLGISCCEDHMLSQYSKEMGISLRKILNGDHLSDVLEQLKRCPAGLDSVLSSTVKFGVAFHHAGLTFDERDIIEGAFRQGILKILVATSTLSSGVNLPARRVIIRSPIFHGTVIDILSYKQMVGRAGRKGIDTEGESILLCKENERVKVVSLINSALTPVQSCLLNQNFKLSNSIKRAVLEVIASGVASTQEEVSLYASCTLAAVSQNEDGMNNAIKSSLAFLIENEFIHLQNVEKENVNYTEYKPTKLGQAVLASSMSPDESLRVLKELQQARKCFVLNNELHLLYQVIPPYLNDQIEIKDWIHYLTLWESLSEDMKRVGELIGVEERFIARAIRGQINSTVPKQAHGLAVHRRFYITLALNDLIQEIPLSTVSKKYDCPRGMLQSLQQSAATFSGMITVFCGRLGWHNMELLISQFQKRLHFGIQYDLCDLIRLISLNAQRARVLHNAGYETVASLATASINEIELVLKNSVPFQSAKQDDNETEYDLRKRHQARTVWITGHKGLTEKEAAEMIIEDARKVVQLDLGVEVKDWTNSNDDDLLLESFKTARSSKETLTDNFEEKMLKKSASTNHILDNTSFVTNSCKTDMEKMVKGSENESQHLPAIKISPMRNSKLKSLTVLLKDNTLFEMTHNCSRTVKTNSIPFIQKSNKSLQESITKTNQIRSQENSDTLVANLCKTESINPVVKSSDSIEFSESFVIDTQVNNFLNSVEKNSTVLLNVCGNTEKHLLDLIEDSNQINLMEKNSYPQIEKRNHHKERQCNKDSKSLESNHLMKKTNENLTSINSSENVFKNLHLEIKNLKSEFDDNSLLTDSKFFNVKWYTDNTSFDLSSEKSASRANSSSSVFSATSINISDKENKITDDENINTEIVIEDRLQGVSNYDACSQNLISTLDAALAMSPWQDYSKSILQDFKGILTSTPSNYFTDLKSNQMKRLRGDETPTINKKSKSASSSSSSDCISPTPPKSSLPMKPCSTHTEFSDKNSTKQLLKGNSPDKSFNDSLECSDDFIFVSDTLSLEHGRSVLNIVNVANNYQVFRKFISEWKKKAKFSFNIAFENVMQSSYQLTNGIGNNVQKENESSFFMEESTPISGISTEGRNMIVGMSVCWDSKYVFYISFTNLHNDDYRLTTKEKLKEIRQVLETSDKQRTCVAFDLKEKYRMLSNMCGIFLTSECNTNWQDPKIADWLLDCGGKEKSLYKMVTNYLPMKKAFLEDKDGEKFNGRKSRQKYISNKNSMCKRKCVVETSVIFDLMDHLWKKLVDLHLDKTFSEIEMPSLLVLAKMEQNGFGFDPEEGKNLQRILQQHLHKLTEEAYKLAKRRFSLNSPEEVAKVLFKELKLIVNNKSSVKETRNMQHSSTAKQVLLKLKDVHPLPSIILEWRKIHSALHKTVFPLLKRKSYCGFLKMMRLYCRCDVFTSTGRINLYDPNLQTVPRDFTLQSENASEVISLRSSFIPFKGAMLLTADFSQLEIRILAHLSNDKKLINLLNSGGDIFKIIASQWKNISPDNISEVDRQYAKQICYGMVYGIGIKTLADQLDVNEEQASVFMETFKATYPGIRKYLQSMVNVCRKQGYVETLYRRRRYLPSINSRMIHIRSKAERQAINTIIQGSASDLLKIAMININKDLEDIYPQTNRTHRYNASGRTYKERSLLRGGYLVSELHDELIYEVWEKDLATVIGIVKHNMESAIPLSVNLPVKIKVGKNWGNVVEWSNAI